MIFDDEELAVLQRMIGQIDDEQTGKVLTRLVVLLGLLERKINESDYGESDYTG